MYLLSDSQVYNSCSLSHSMYFITVAHAIHSYRISFVKGVWDFVYQKSANSTAIWASKGIIIPTNFGNLEGRKKICKFYPYCVTSKKTLKPYAPCAFTLYRVS